MRVTVAEVAGRLTGVHWSGDAKFVARCPAHDDSSPSLSVCAGEKGGIVLHCFAGCSPEAIVAELGMEMADLAPPRLTLAASSGKTAPYLRLWKESIPAAGTLAESYFHARGITVPLPPSVRFLPSCLYAEREPPIRRELPAVVAPIQIGQKLIGIHRTYLAPDGSAKALVPAPKKMLGNAKGGAVRLGPVAEQLGIAEGIETALSAMQADGRTVWAALSSIGVKEIVLPDEVREVVIYVDADKAGIDAADTLARRLALRNVRVGLKRPPDGKDFNDLLREGGENAIREIPIEWRDATANQGLPVLDAESGDLLATLAAVRAAVTAWNSPPRLFVSETTKKLVRLVWREPAGPNESPHLYLDDVGVDGFRNILVTCARWIKHTRRGPEPAYPRTETVKSAYDFVRTDGGLPLLRAIVYAPTFARGGRLLKPGYDAETRLWYEAEDDGAVDEDDPEAFHRSVELLNEMLHDFLFESSGDLAHAISLFLLPFVREMVDGPVPLYNIEAPGAGTGKGLLAFCLLRPSLSYRIVPETTRPDEAEKQIAAVCLNGWGTALLDNISCAVKSPLLASLVTSRETELRVMGSLRTVAVRRVPTFVITANNPIFSEENARRVARIRITSPIEDPSEREGFLHVDLIGWVEEHRRALCHAGVTIVREWLRQGQPAVKTRPWGSFEAWANVMASLLASVGVDGFGTARIDRTAAVDTAESRWRELVDRWGERYGEQPLRASDITILADEIDGFFSERETKNKSLAIGQGLRNRRDRIFGNWQLKLNSTLHGNRLWRLSAVQ